MNHTVLFIGVMAVMLVERGIELAINRRNSERLAKRGAVWLRRDGFEWILLAQVALFGGLTAEATFAPWIAVHTWTWPLIGALVVAQALRYWCITTLGERWSIRVVTVPGAPRILGGPYRFLPHPNYAVVMVEAIVLPLVFGAYVTLLVAAPLQLFAIVRRVRLEERALQEAEPVLAHHST